MKPFAAVLILAMSLIACDEARSPQPDRDRPGPIAGAPVAAAEEPLTRMKPGEQTRPFVERALGRTEESDDLRFLDSVWNGRRVIFADFLRGEEREVWALQERKGGAFRKLHVTTGQHEGGYPNVEAIGFANADRDRAQEMILILTWPVHHYDVGGRLYSVRILDDPKPGETRLRPLDSFSKRFEDMECDCDWRDGSSKRYPFKTIASVKRALQQAGY